MENFSIDCDSKFQLKQKINSEFSLFKCWVASVGKNRNMSYIDKNAMDKAVKTLPYTPVVAHLIEENGKYRLGSHDVKIDEDFNIVPVTVPVGVVVADSFSYEDIDEYGIQAKYLCCDVILWTGRYPELMDCKYSEEVFCGQSMEISVNEYRPLGEDSNYVEILDFNFSALCLLNKSDNKELNVTPCFINAKLEPYKFNFDESFTQKVNELKEEISKCFTAQKEGEKMQDNNFQLTANETREKMNESLDKMTIVSDTESSYFLLNDYDDTYVYVTQIIYSNNSHGQRYGRMTYSKNSDSISINSDFEEMKCMWLTLDEYNSIQEARDNYDSVREQVAILTEYKSTVEKAEREKAEKELFAKYDSIIGEMTEYNDMKNNTSEYSIEELESKCLMFVGMFSMANNKPETEVDTDSKLVSFSLDDIADDSTSKSLYGGLFEKYGK